MRLYKIWDNPRFALSFLCIAIVAVSNEWFFGSIIKNFSSPYQSWSIYGLHFFQGLFVAFLVALWRMRIKLRFWLLLPSFILFEIVALLVELKFANEFGPFRQAMRGLRFLSLVSLLVLYSRSSSPLFWRRIFAIALAFFAFELLTIAPDPFVALPVTYSPEFLGFFGYLFYAGVFVLYISTVLGTLLFLHSTSRTVRWTTYLLFIFSITMLLSYRDFSFHITPETMELILKELQFANQYYGIAASAAWRYVVAGFIFVLILEFFLKRWIPRFKARTLLFASALWMLSFNLNYFTKSTFLSPLFKISILLPATLLRERPHVKREKVYFLPVKRPQVRNIVLLIDESTTGERFTINGYPVQTTPYLVSAQKSFINFGITSSGFTRTYMSHAFMQSGVRVKQVAQISSGHLALDVRTLPTLFQYAKWVGMKNYFIDGPTYARGRGLLQLTDLKRYVDGVVKIKDKYRGISRAMVDSRVADELVDILRRDPKSYKFIYIKKQGTHYPFEGRYPRSEVHFKPCLNPYKMRAFQVGNDKKLAARVMRSHHNALRWSTDTFFKRLMPRLKALKQSTLVIYTSDHGHALEGCKWKNYCWYLDIQSSVPLLFMPFNTSPDLVKRLHKANKLNHNRLSHFEIFPTILQLFGYPKDKVFKRYEESVFDKVRKPRFQLHGRYASTGDGERAGHNKFRLKPFHRTDLRKYIVH